jgi:hypothetical protein
MSMFINKKASTPNLGITASSNAEMSSSSSSSSSLLSSTAVTRSNQGKYIYLYIYAYIYCMYVKYIMSDQWAHDLSWPGAAI